MKCTRQVRHHAHSVELFAEVRDVKRHEIVDVLCRPVVNVVIGVHIVVLSVPLIVVHICCPNSHTVVVHPTLKPVAIFHMCSLYSHGLLGVVFTPTVGYSGPPSDVNDRTVTKHVNW